MMAEMAEVLRPIVAEVQVGVPLAKLWDVTTSEATVPQWLGCMNYRKAVGATFHMQPDGAKKSAGDLTGATHCEIVGMKEPHKLDFTWFVPGTPATLVEISLFSEGPARSFVRMVHSGWDQFPADAVRGFHDQLTIGWKEGVLPNLKRVAEAS
jgi:uncharacterized protein YndB with AHSA1/START domain